MQNSDSKSVVTLYSFLWKRDHVCSLVSRSVCVMPRKECMVYGERTNVQTAAAVRVRGREGCQGEGNTSWMRGLGTLIRIEVTLPPTGISLYSPVSTASFPSISASLCRFPGQHPGLCSLTIPCCQAPDLAGLLCKHKWWGLDPFLSHSTWDKNSPLTPKKRHCHQHYQTEWAGSCLNRNLLCKGFSLYIQIYYSF